ncbi:hypothetical protein A2442_00755 [Candidatus Campbellbacteria bacterium RIFOXYC2_FULL_35_25]|uniref:HAD family hydrolase n=1 Tax=Candidatus Campbellbacteria bacterium RIFOXYC2_FULL_35_25 TaxID=1797582 RepID=A0A1F5EJA5_9BACT|nr:MAG: hypothetical protein A2442_00755 [Candidatus Campbellbacteria bacterium RIFOXYC2_FULL_35_25]
MKKAFIFDWSGTLSDNFHCFYKVCGLIFEDQGGTLLSEEEIKINFTMPYMKFWNKYFPDLTKEKAEELYEKFIHQVGEPDIFYNVQQVVEYLKMHGFELFIVSSDPISKLMPEIERSGISHFITKTIGGGNHLKEESIASLVEEYGLDRANTFYVGDTCGDVEFGKMAQVKTVAITWGIQHKDVVSKSNPDYLIDDIIEIQNII